MAITTRQGLIDYALRRLGQPVIEINIDEDQLSERVDDALDYFSEYHFDGVEKIYLKHTITTTDITNEYIPVNDAVISVVRVLPIPTLDSFQGSFFNEEYQLRLQDLDNLSGTALIDWSMTQMNFSLIEQLFSIAPQMLFNRKQDRIYLETDWEKKFSAGNVIVVEAYRSLDPATYPQVYNDMFLKRYTTALIKKQWGANLSKFNGVAMLGGVTLNGQQIYSEALTDIQKLEEEIRGTYETPVTYMVG